VSDDHTDAINLGMTARAEGGKGMTGASEDRGMQPVSMVKPVAPPPPPPAPSAAASSVRPGSGGSSS
jgi:hypothetical protein